MPFKNNKYDLHSSLFSHLFPFPIVLICSFYVSLLHSATFAASLSPSIIGMFFFVSPLLQHNISNFSISFDRRYIFLVCLLQQHDICSFFNSLSIPFYCRYVLLHLASSCLQHESLTISLSPLAFFHFSCIFLPSLLHSFAAST